MPLNYGWQPAPVPTEIERNLDKSICLQKYYIVILLGLFQLKNKYIWAESTKHSQTKWILLMLVCLVKTILTVFYCVVSYVSFLLKPFFQQQGKSNFFKTQKASRRNVKATSDKKKKKKLKEKCICSFFFTINADLLWIFYEDKITVIFLIILYIFPRLVCE